MHLRLEALLSIVVAAVRTASTHVGESFVIPGWDLESVGKAGNDLASLSSPSYDSQSWYRVGSRATVFAGLIEAGVYNTTQLFFSENLQDTVDYLPYYSPWLYRSQFNLAPSSGSHFFLQTNGITSKADIYLNGKQVANKLTQAGAYGGHIYDITHLAQKDNALVVKAYQTYYNLDFGLGWVDWNPYPPDNGTGIWRNVSVKQTGPLLMGPVRIVHDYTPGANSVRVSLKGDVTNLDSSTVTGIMRGSIAPPANTYGNPIIHLAQTFKLGPSQTQTVTTSATIDNPEIWWPKQWGDQPLYMAQAVVFARGELSDQAAPQQFGVRHIMSEVNQHNDTIFSINGYPFQVLGGGYAPDVFLRWDAGKFESQAKYVLDMGLNTIRLEGKEEQPELFEIADRLGLMVMPGWECCDKWEAWSYNDEIDPPPPLDNANDYQTMNASMRHEAAMLQSHPSILAFLVGSDYWPNDRAAAIYVQGLQDLGWQNPIICSAAKRGYPEILGPSGMKMDGPYDWVPPNYWYGDQEGAAFGFGSELGAGVGTPEMGSLKQFLSESDLNDLWTKPDKGLYHMSTNVSTFYHRTIYNKAMWNRYGKPTGLEDYLLKAQIMDYEATRAEFEGYSAKWNAERPATGAIYWMLNNAWPSLHWNLFDYYLHPAGSYFGAKIGSRVEHVAYNYDEKTVYLINHSLTGRGNRNIEIELIDLSGNIIAKESVSAQTEPNTSKSLVKVPGIEKLETVAFLRLVLTVPHGHVLSRNVYWLSTNLDKLEWGKSTWYYTPVSSYADLTTLSSLKETTLSASVSKVSSPSSLTVTLHNKGDVPAFFIRLNLVDADGNDITPVIWTDNYVTLWPKEKLVLDVSYSAETEGSVAVQISGSNVGEMRTVDAN